MKGKRPKIKDAIEALQYALIHDEEYRGVWRANIAMAVYDTKRWKKELIHEWRNRCAEQAIGYLCAGHPDDAKSKLMEAIGH